MIDVRTAALTRLAAEHALVEPIDPAPFANAVGRYLERTAAELTAAMTAKGYEKASTIIRVGSSDGQVWILIGTDSEAALPMRGAAGRWSSRVFAGVPSTLADLIAEARACVADCAEHSSMAMAPWFIAQPERSAAE